MARSWSDLQWQAQDNCRIFSVPFVIVSTTMGPRCERLKHGQTPIGQRAVRGWGNDPFEVWYPEGNWMEARDERNGG